MKGDGAIAERIAERLSDGLPVNWEEAEASAESDEERAIIRNLRLVSSISDVHQGQRPEAIAQAPTLLSGAATIDRVPTAPAVTWGHLELRELIGKGAFGEVYRAWDPKLEREVALKLLYKLHPEDRATGTAVIREGRMMAKVNHVNVVRVYGADEHDGRVGLWMELIEGRTLASALKASGRMAWREAAGMGIDICRALTAIHNEGIVHHDVKAENVMREEGGRLVLMDFSAGREPRTEPGGDGRVSGTPLYMPPEALLGGAMTPRADIYSLGVLLYHLVTNAYPVEAASMKELRAAHIRREFRPLRSERSDLAEEFLQVVERALEWDPEKRFATAGHMEQALSRSLQTITGDGAGAREDEERARAGREEEGVERRLKGRFSPLRIAAGIAAVAAAVSVAILLAPYVEERLNGNEPEPLVKTPIPAQPEHPSPAPGEEAQLPPAAPAASYTDSASLFRDAPDGKKERLVPGARIRQGDSLFMEMEASAPVYVYILNEDEAGEVWTLFPWPGISTLQNPLPPDRLHELPGPRAANLQDAGRQNRWGISSSHGEEHILVVASPERVMEIEAELLSVPRPQLAAQGGHVQLSPETVSKIKTRGLGGIAVSQKPVAAVEGSGTMERLKTLADGTENVSGLWMRQIDLENPPPR